MDAIVRSVDALARNGTSDTAVVAAIGVASDAAEGEVFIFIKLSRLESIN